jgi:3-deoxy-D-manno-octulosonic acid kinase
MTVPPGYTVLADGARRAVVRDDLVPALAAWLLTAPLAPPAEATPIGGGRGAAFRVPSAGGIVVRFGRRGGAIARLVRDRYLDVRPRPWRELAVSIAARERGAPVPEVLAACVHGWGAYRSAIVTRELPGVAPILAALAAVPPGESRAAVAAAAGVAVARLHRAGVVHADLNLSNIVVGDDVAAIVDLDRARLRTRGLGPRIRERSLRRLRRSLAKLDPDGALVDPDVRRRFHDAYVAAYTPGLEQPCAS